MAFEEQFLIVQGNMAQGSIITKTVDLRGVEAAKFIVEWSGGSGSPAGTLSLESSTTGINFTTITESAQNIIDDEGFHIWDFPYNPFELIRVRYVRTSGDGNMDIRVQLGGRN
jgi:hypothetical protein